MLEWWITGSVVEYESVEEQCQCCGIMKVWENGVIELEWRQCAGIVLVWWIGACIVELVWWNSVSVV